MSDWKPGDVAAINGVRAIRADHVWHTQSGILSDHNVHTVRPLVVIDLEDVEQVARLQSALDAWGYKYDGNGERVLKLKDHSCIQAALREFASPPKPEEPLGLGAVVVDRSNEMWVRSRGDRKALLGIVWGNGFSLRHAAWSDIDAVKILSEGVTP